MEGLRLKALFIDVAIILIVWIIVFMVSAYLLNKDTEYMYRYNMRMAIIMSLFLCKDNINGQSIGKRICNLKVVGYNGKNLTTMKLIMRNLFVFIAPVEFILLLHYNKRIGDNVIKSKVVMVKEASKITFANISTYALTLFFLVFAYLLIAYLGISLLSVMGLAR